MIAVIDYDTGNLRSVANALGRLGAEFTVTGDAETIRSADRVLLPGVGEASSAMEKLRQRGLVEVIRSLTRPVLGICIGVQLMCRRSAEGDTPCMGIFDTDVKRLGETFSGRPACSCGCMGPAAAPAEELKVPEMGWNTVERLRSPLFTGLEEGAYVYYVHSYAPGLCPQTIATTLYGGPFSAALGRDNFYGTQFHPEKSGRIGERILKNFLEL